ncbi:MAG: hypothetical protein HKN59_07275 [Gammaproteobacteria bacterium]|nr:hypothetical protein [Gammaproteobacteria bacterium]
MPQSIDDAGDERMLVLISYILHLIGTVTALPSLIALLINYVKRSSAAPFDSHHRWMIRTFWWTILWMILGGILVFLVLTAPLGWLVGGIAWLWWIYRHVRGLIALLNNSALPS